MTQGMVAAWHVLSSDERIDLQKLMSTKFAASGDSLVIEDVAYDKE